MKNTLKNSHARPLYLCLPVLVLLALGCNFMERLSKINYFEAEATQTAAEAIKQKIGKPFKVFEINITPEGFMLQAQDRLCTKITLFTPIFVQKTLFLCNLGNFCAGFPIFVQDSILHKN